MKTSLSPKDHSYHFLRLVLSDRVTYLFFLFSSNFDHCRPVCMWDESSHKWKVTMALSSRHQERSAFVSHKAVNWAFKIKESLLASLPLSYYKWSAFFFLSSYISLSASLSIIIIILNYYYYYYHYQP